MPDIFCVCGQSFFRSNRFWNGGLERIDISFQESHFFSDPRARNIVHIAIHGNDFLTLVAVVFDLGTREGESTVFVFWLCVDEDGIAGREALENQALVEPHSFRMDTISIGQNRFDEEFFIACNLAREEFDRTLDRLFLSDIHERKACNHITLILDITGIEMEKIGNRVNPCF